MTLENGEIVDITAEKRRSSHEDLSSKNKESACFGVDISSQAQANFSIGILDENALTTCMRQPMPEQKVVEVLKKELEALVTQTSIELHDQLKPNGYRQHRRRHPRPSLPQWRLGNLKNYDWKYVYGI